MKIPWHETKVSADETHHLYQANPFYEKKFRKVLKYHSPGLAPVVDEAGAYHIDLTGNAVYQYRFLQTFGYYENLAAVESAQGWLHIDVFGKPIYDQRYAWCGNYQENFCVVKDLLTGSYYHIARTGERIYVDNYRYVGDYRDGIAVVCADNGLHTHIDVHGNYIHDKWFLGLDVFHKSVARARDEGGWFHVDRNGCALYSQRYKNIEPYYNNVAHVEDFNGGLYTINLSGEKITVIRAAENNYLGELSADLVGFWKTQTILAAVKLKVFDVLPNNLNEITIAINLDKKICQRLLRALQEINLVYSSDHNYWSLTAKGELLKPTQKSAMAAATIVWGESHYKQWLNLTDSLRNSTAQYNDYFIELAQNKDLLITYQRALTGYALHDYQKITTQIDWSQHQKVIDAGGGIGVLLHSLLDEHEHLSGALLEMSEVIDIVDKHARCNYFSANILQPWPCKADAIILARVLHDWSDEYAITILQYAKASLIKNGKIYLLEMILPTDSAMGGLLDLNMLVMTGGCERSLQQWQALATAAQLQLIHTEQVSSVVNLIILEAHV